MSATAIADVDVIRSFAGPQAEEQVRRLERRGSTDLARVEEQVRQIVGEVRRDGDGPLRRYAQRWDGLEPGTPLQVTEAEMERAWHAVSEQFRLALRTAGGNIQRYCKEQRFRAWSYSPHPGSRVGQVLRPLRSAGCYVPGGRYPLPSTLLMTVIPAQVADVNRICVVSPRPAPETLAAAYFLGVREFYRIGGAHAIAALAYGAESVPRVDKIVGPGNLFVTAAKKVVAFDCGIDFLAGPTELVIVSHRGEPRFIAADLIAQAEHDPDASSVFITTSGALAQAVAQRIQDSLGENQTARTSLTKNGAILIVASPEEAMDFANRIAPEHITVSEEDLPRVHSAGAIFVGDYSPPAAGDYAVGPNHVLPTGAAARVRGGLSVLDFVKVISLQHLSRGALRQLAPAVTALADAEGLSAHAESIRVRFAHA